MNGQILTKYYAVYLSSAGFGLRIWSAILFKWTFIVLLLFIFNHIYSRRIIKPCPVLLHCPTHFLIRFDTLLHFSARLHWHQFPSSYTNLILCFVTLIQDHFCYTSNKIIFVTLRSVPFDTLNPCSVMLQWPQFPHSYTDLMFRFVTLTQAHFCYTISMFCFVTRSLVSPLLKWLHLFYISAFSGLLH